LLEPKAEVPPATTIAKPLEGKTSIIIEKEPRDVLRRLARKGQTYDNLIREMIVKCYSSTK
jgi:hypothetical protein